MLGLPVFQWVLGGFGFFHVTCGCFPWILALFHECRSPCTASAPTAASFPKASCMCTGVADSEEGLGSRRDYSTPQHCRQVKTDILVLKNLSAIPISWKCFLFSQAQPLTGPQCLTSLAHVSGLPACLSASPAKQLSRVSLLVRHKKRPLRMIH